MSREWIAKGLLALVFLLAAILKVQAEAKGNSPWATALLVLWVAVDVLVVLGLWTRWWRFACWTVLVIAAFGSFVYLRTPRGETCGCFGVVVLSPAKHAALSCARFVVAAILLSRHRTRA